MLPSALLPILFVITAVGDANAQAQTFGAWKVSTDKSAYAWAGTINDSGHVFGQFCDSPTAHAVGSLARAPRVGKARGIRSS